MNERERIAELEAKVDQLERDDELSRLRLQDAKAAAKVQAKQIAKLRDEIERLRGRRSVAVALSASARLRPFADALSSLAAIWRPGKPATVSGAEGAGVPVTPAAAPGDPATFRDHLIRALGDRDGSTARPLRIAIAAADKAVAIREDLEQLGWQVTDLDLAGDGWTRPDASIDVVLVLEHDLDVRRLPRRVVTVAWLGDDAAAWLGQAWFDEFDVVMLPSDDLDQVRRDSAKVATPIDPSAPPGPAIRSALSAWASSTRFGLLVGISNW